MRKSMESDIYIKRGVSSSKSDVHKALTNIDKGLYPGAFCKILPDLVSGSDDHALLMHADGAGTKSSLAYVYWKETGDVSIFRGIAMDSLVMNLDDLACVGAVDSFILSNTIGRNRSYIPGEVIQEIVEGYEEAADTLREYGVQIHSSGGETADLGDLVRTLVVDSTLTARIKKSDIVDLDQVKPGNVIVGFASHGQAVWEKEYNSGIGSNGLTAARHDVFHHDYASKYPESFNPDIDDELVYCGPGRIEDPLEGTPLTLGKAVLSPTRTYTPLVKKALKEFRKGINGVLHCSGGGQTKCLKFGQNIHYFKDNLMPVPPLFSHIQKVTGQPWKNLFPVYNMGHRLEMYVEPEVAEDLISMSRELKIDAQIVGRCESSETGNKVSINWENETHEYSE
jgi:phosphoribosylformylglycinamidine cyclo-ligase